MAIADMQEPSGLLLHHVAKLCEAISGQVSVPPPPARSPEASFPPSAGLGPPDITQCNTHARQNPSLERGLRVMAGDLRSGSSAHRAPLTPRTCAPEGLRVQRARAPTARIGLRSGSAAPAAPRSAPRPPRRPGPVAAAIRGAPQKARRRRAGGAAMWRSVRRSRARPNSICVRRSAVPNLGCQNKSSEF